MCFLMIHISLGLLFLKAWLQKRMATTEKLAPEDKNRPIFHWKVQNFSYDDVPHPTIKLRCPGLSHESFDRDLKPKIMSIMMTSAVARATALRRPIRVIAPKSDSDDKNPEVETFLDFTKLSNDYFTFMSSSEFVMSRTLYDNRVSKWPLDMKFTQGFVGNSSVANVSHFYACDEEDKRNASDLGQTPLWTNTYQIVLIDKTTRKPTQLPDWFKEKFKGKGCMEKGFILKTFARPAVTFSQLFKVQWTDTDQYNHTNFTTYVRWALDALHAALHSKANLQKSSEASSPQKLSSNASDAEKKSSDASNPKKRSSDTSDPPERPRDAHNTQQKPSDESDLSKKALDSADGSINEGLSVLTALPYINKEMLAQGLHKMQVTYLRECLEGENVEVHIWQEEGSEKELVLFSVVKDGDDVCQMKMWYFPAEEGLKQS